MSLVRDVLRELGGMFVADARLSAAILAMVAAVAALLRLAHLPGLVAGAALAAGIAGVILLAVRGAARSGR